MSVAGLSLIMDVAVLTGLAATLYYAMRLSKSLDGFRKYRQEFGALIGDLSRNIDKAQQAIQAMRSASTESGGNLQEVIDEARLLADELQLINQASNSLATRLETLAQKNSAAARQYDAPYQPRADIPDAPAAPQESDYFSAVPRAEKPALKAGRGAGQSFAIQDRDYDETGDAADPAGFESRAERELFEALQKNQKTGRKGGF